MVLINDKGYVSFLRRSFSARTDNLTEPLILVKW